MVVELDRATPEFPMNALRVSGGGGKVLSAARVGGGDRDRPRYSYVVQADGNTPVHLRVGTMRRVSAEGTLESGWEGEPEQGIEVLPHPALGTTTSAGAARSYLGNPAVVGAATWLVAAAGAAGATGAAGVGVWRRFAAYKVR